MTIYAVVLILHSWLRWVVLAAGLVAWARSAFGSSRPWTRTDDRAGFWFVTSLDLQLVLGLALYFLLSPTTATVMRNFGAAMKDPALRFWAVEHVFGMIIGVALAHVGRARGRRVDGARRRRTTAIFFGLALLAIALSIPWPGSQPGRPLLRW